MLERARGRKDSAAAALTQRLHGVERIHRLDHARSGGRRERQNAAEAEHAEAGARLADRRSDLRLLHNAHGV